MNNNNDIKTAFQETLAELVEFATVSGNIISKEAVHEYFKDLITDDAQYDSIYQYLANAKINVEGFSAKPAEQEAQEDKPQPKMQKKEESEEAIAFYHMYLEEMKALSQPEQSQISGLLQDFLNGNSDACHSLSEYYLPMVLKLAQNFDDYGLAHSDLVAEGNLALFEAILAYPAEQKDTSKLHFEQFLTSRILQALQDAVNAEIGSNRISNHLAEQINALNDASTELAKTLEREATLKELCEHLSLPAEKVKELMKISIDALTVVPADEELNS